MTNGFIRTRHWRDTAKGTEIEFWVATDDGPRRIVQTAQTSVAFARAEFEAKIAPEFALLPGARMEPLALKDFERRPVLGIYCQQYWQLTGLERTLKEKNIPLYEADIRPSE